MNPTSQQRQRSVSMSSCQSVMEINTNTVINEHTGPTFVGSNMSNSDGGGIVNLNEEIQINIQSDSAITIESNDKVPQIIIKNYGPTINLTNEVLHNLKRDGQWENFLQQIFNLSLKLRSENEKLEKIEENDVKDVVTTKVSKLHDIEKSGLGHVTISISKANYSLKNINRHKSCWNLFLPQQYLSLFRGIFSVFMLGTTVAVIYGIIIILKQ